ncbi:MAG TPA: hypothetical protein VGM23_12325, partial [Armatimonadota bacterium]
MRGIAVGIVLLAMAGLSGNALGETQVPLTQALPSVRIAPQLVPEIPAWKGRAFSPPPAPGVHPRVLISPADLPALRERLEKTGCGKRAIAGVRAWVDGAIFRPKAPLGKVYAALVAGDDKALTYADSEWWLGNVPLVLCLNGFDCLVRDDAERAKTLAVALTTFARLTGGEARFVGVNAVNPDYAMGLCYDFIYNYMTDAQRESVRAVIAKATAGKQSHGMDMPAHACTYNFMPHGTQLALLALCIEGEAGYDPAVYRKTAELMHAFLNYGIYPSGAPTEEMHYYN